MTENTLQKLQKLDTIEDELLVRNISNRQLIKRSFVATDSTTTPQQLLLNSIALQHKALQSLDEHNFTYSLPLVCSSCNEPSVVLIQETGQLRVECTHCGKKHLEV